MNKVFPAILVFVLLALTACAATKKKTGGQELSYVQMQRTPCFGRCPVYKIEVYKNGLVRYTGLRFTPDSGVYEKNIGSAKARALLGRFAAKRIDTLKKDYPVPVSDLPGIFYNFRYGNTSKEVRNAQFGPSFLKELATTLDQLVNREATGTPELDRSWKKMQQRSQQD